MTDRERIAIALWMARDRERWVNPEDQSMLEWARQDWRIHNTYRSLADAVLAAIGDRLLPDHKPTDRAEGGERFTRDWWLGFEDACAWDSELSAAYTCPVTDDHG